MTPIKDAILRQRKKFLEKKEQTQQKKVDEEQTKKREKKKYQEALERNPYLQSKALWNDMYGSIQTKLENSYRINMVLAAVIIIAMFGFVHVSSESKVQPMPFIVHGNEVLTVDNSAATDLHQVKPQLALYFTKNFIRDVRSVSVDGDVNAAHRIAALSFVSGEAVNVLKNFYGKNDPNVIANHFVKNVAITSVLRNSPNTLTIRWQESWRSLNSGELIKTRNYIAQITYQYSKLSQNTIILRNNPLGFDITDLSWSEDTN